MKIVFESAFIVSKLKWDEIVGTRATKDYNEDELIWVKEEYALWQAHEQNMDCFIG